MKVFFKGLFFSLFAFLVVSCSDIFSGRDEYADVELNLNTAVARESNGDEFYTTLIIKLLNVKSKKVELERNFDWALDSTTPGTYRLPRVKKGSYILLIQLVDNYGCVRSESRQEIAVSSKKSNIAAELKHCLVNNYESLATRIEMINNDPLIGYDEEQTIVISFSEDVLNDTFRLTNDSEGDYAITIKKKVKIVTPVYSDNGEYYMWQLNRGGKTDTSGKITEYLYRSSILCNRNRFS